MSEGGERGARRPFEPPPWEREQFEELARRRAETAVPEASAEDATVAPGDDQAKPPETGEAAEASREATTASKAADQEVSGGLDEKMTEAMIVQLSGEERTTLAPMRKAGRLAAWIMGLVGVSMIVLGSVYAMRAPGSGVAIAGAATMAVVGAFIAAAAAWLWIRASQGQGS